MKIIGKVLKLSEMQENETLSFDKQLFKKDDEKRDENGYFLMTSGCFGYGKEDDCIDELKDYGVKGVIAESFAPIQYRNLINSGILPIKNLNNGWIKNNTEIEIDLKNWKIGDKTGKIKSDISPINQTIIDIFKSGGLFNMSKK